MITIEQWKNRAFIGILSFISIAVNASYARVHGRYQNGAALVQRTERIQPSAPVLAAAKISPFSDIAAPQTIPAANTAETPPVSYAPAAQPAFLPVVQDSPPADVRAVPKPRVEHPADGQKLLRKEERREEHEEAKQANEEVMATNAISINTNAIETAKESKESKSDNHEALSPKETDQIAGAHQVAGNAYHASKDSMPQIAREQGKNSEHFGGSAMKKSVDTKVASVSNERISSISLGSPKEIKTETSQTPPPKEIKTASVSALAPDEVKTPPNAPSHSVLQRIWRGFVTGGESGAEYENQNTRHAARERHSQNQSNQSSQQNQQSQNNGNNGGRRR